MGERVIGVLGGMGPEATLELFARILHSTRASRDQDHVRVIIDNNPKVPDRSAAIAGTGESCLPELVRSARALARAGADFIVIPCVTVHHFHGALQRRSRLPILHIVEETVNRVRRRYPRVRRVGLLARTAAIESGLFQRAFVGSRVDLRVPVDRAQRAVETAVKLIKAEGATMRARTLIAGAARRLVEAGAQLVIAGCTEIPLVLKQGDLEVPVIDPITVLAEVAIERAGGRLKRAR